MNNIKRTIFFFKEYNYTFPVRVVANCPMNMSDWQAAAERTGCNDTNAYHCVPDRFHLKLVEFCYYKTPNLVSEGIDFKKKFTIKIYHLPVSLFFMKTNSYLKIKNCKIVCIYISQNIALDNIGC